MGKLDKLFLEMLKGKAVEIRGRKVELRAIQSRLLKYSANNPKLLKGREVKTRTVGKCMFAWITKRGKEKKNGNK